MKIIEKKYSALFELIFVKTIMNLRSEASRTYLSYTWWVLEPLMHMAVYYVVFGLLLSRGGEDFVVFLLIGITHWLWFSKTVSNSTMSIVQGRGLMTQIDIPKVFFPLVVVMQDFIKQIPVFILLIVFLLFYGNTLSITWLAWPIIIFCEFLLIAVLSIAASAIVPFMYDLRILIMTGLQFLMFLSGVFFSHEIVPENYLDIYFLNPMAKLLYMHREVLMYGHWPDWGALGVLFFVCCILLLITTTVINRFDHIYPRLVLE